jgi:hypothetical protein
MEEPITTLVGGRRASDRAVNAWLRLLLVLNQLERVAGVVAHEEEDLGRVLGENCEESSRCVLRVRDTLCSIALRPIALICDE